MKTIKQPDNWSCVICCVEMISFCERDEAIEYALKTDPKLKTEGIDHYNMIPFLFERGIVLGSFFTDFLPPEDQAIDDIDEVDVKLQFRGNPFLLTVDSWRFEGKQHLVLWDGHDVRDPNPEAPEKTKLSQYNIISLDQIMFRSTELYDKFVEYYHD